MVKCFLKKKQINNVSLVIVDVALFAVIINDVTFGFIFIFKKMENQ